MSVTSRSTLAVRKTRKNRFVNIIDRSEMFVRKPEHGNEIYTLSINDSSRIQAQALSRAMSCKSDRRTVEEGRIFFFNNTFNTFYGVGHMVKDHSDSREREKCFI